MAIRKCKLQNPKLSINAMCKIMGRTKPAFYQKEKYKTKERIEDNIIVKKVKYIKNKLPMTGGKKLKYMLERRKIHIGRDRLFNLLKKNKLLVRRRRKFARTTQSDHWYKKYRNTFRFLNVTKPEQAFVSDITYIRLKDNFCYLSLVTDAYSKRIMGSKLHRDLSRDGTVAALSEAIENRIYDHPLLHHSDRGFQYCSHDYIETLKNSNIDISMTESGSPYDNAIAERVNGILKSELGLDTEFNDYEKALKAVELAVMRYNKNRPHLSCGFLTPNQAHKTKKPFLKLWKKKVYRSKAANKSYSDEEAGPSEAKASEIGNNFCLKEQFINTNNL